MRGAVIQDLDGNRITGMIEQFLGGNGRGFGVNRQPAKRKFAGQRVTEEHLRTELRGLGFLLLAVVFEGQERPRVFLRVAVARARSQAHQPPGELLCQRMLAIDGEHGLQQERRASRGRFEQFSQR